MKERDMGEGRKGEGDFRDGGRGLEKGGGDIYSFSFFGTLLFEMQTCVSEIEAPA